ncbi:MAG: hypothetical protein ACKOTZ_11460 [Chloroflexota bacterium]
MGVVPLADHATWMAHVTGQRSVIQYLWRYDRPVDPDALRVFESHLRRGRLARVIRPALLPGCRPTWAAVPPAAATCTTSRPPLPPDAMAGWADAQIELPIDPARGPAWNLTARRFGDATTLVSLVVSHAIADGMGTTLAVCEAVRGEERPVAWPPLGSRRPLGAVGREAARFVADLPAVGRALGASVRPRARGNGDDRAGPEPRGTTAMTGATGAGTDHIALPTVHLRVPVAAWDARARALGGNRFTLLTAVTVALGDRLGRARDGQVTLFIPIDQRDGADDDGGNRVTLARTSVDRAWIAGPLGALQRTVQRGLVAARRNPDPLAALLPLVPFVPRRGFAALTDRALRASAERPVTLTHLGVMPDELLRIDGQDADRFAVRGVDQGLRRAAIERRGGVATLVSAVTGDALLLNVIAWEAGVVTTPGELRDVVDPILAGHGLRGVPFHG